jgi:hypothetical protein
MGFGMVNSRAAVHAKMRHGLRTIVEAQHCGDDALQLGGDVHGAGAAAVGTGREMVIEQLDVKRFAEVGDGPAQRHGTLRQVGARDG